MQLLWLFIWEAAQNIPLVIGFIVGFQFWQQGQWLAAVACMLVGGVAAALIIWITEPKIFEGHHESMQVVIANSLTFPALMLLLVVYLSTGWSSWLTDIASGLILAVILAAAQEVAAGERFGVVRCLALGLSCSISVILIRLLLETSTLTAILVVTLWFTLVMGVYKQLRLQTNSVSCR